ncbi:MAG: methylated-DNA--[protein]-cysteine S-methyltransferase [Prevotella sp.]
MEYYSEYESPIGTIIMLSDGTALTGLWMLEGSRYAPANMSGYTRNDTHPVFNDTRTWLDNYFCGSVPSLMPAIRLTGTRFQIEVLRTLMETPYGSTTTYGELARRVGKRMGKPHMSSQAIGNALGRNPIMLIVPCHRVIRADGSAGGFSAGTDRKERLLRHEGVLPAEEHAPV